MLRTSRLLASTLFLTAVAVPCGQVASAVTLSPSQKVEAQAEQLQKTANDMKKAEKATGATILNGPAVMASVASTAYASLALEMSAVEKARLAESKKIATVVKNVASTTQKQDKRTAQLVAMTAKTKNQVTASTKLLAQMKAQTEAMKKHAALTVPATEVAPKTAVPGGKNTPAWLCQIPSGDTGTQAWPRLVRTRILSQFPAVQTIGGFRPGDPQDHGKGLALDVMVPVSSQLGDEVAGWALTHFKELNLSYVIWKQHIWTAERPYWRQMEDRGSITQNHFDHNHLSFKPGVGTCPAS